MTQKQTQLVLVETVSMFRMRYLVEVPVGTDDGGNERSLWALDTVTCSEAQEFSQKYLNETIVSHRTLTEEEALELCDQDNDYAATWPKKLKIKNFFTPYEGKQNDA